MAFCPKRDESAPVPVTFPVAVERIGKWSQGPSTAQEDFPGLEG